MWQRRMAAFLCGKGQILWDITVDTTYVCLVNFLAPGSRNMFDANNKAVDRGFGMQDLLGAEECSCWECGCSGTVVCDLPERVREFHSSPHESIDALFQWFTVVVNNMRASVDVLPYDDHDRAVKLLHALDRTVWEGKVKAILESEKYTT
jgi:hypothetical protein